MLAMFHLSLGKKPGFLPGYMKAVSRCQLDLAALPSGTRHHEEQHERPNKTIRPVVGWLPREQTSRVALRQNRTHTHRERDTCVTRRK